MWVGERGLEPPTSASRTLRATRLRHSPQMAPQRASVPTFYLSAPQTSNVRTSSRRVVVGFLPTLAALGLVAACGGNAPNNGGRMSSGAGGLLAFAADGNISTMSPDGKGRKQLTKVAGGAFARDPVWSAD